ncbi:MAG: hypothetical protein QOJ73_7164 [Streptosporangiaceae bacterium]|nr:hypothetical protein [Streptosporangiaceae bacterium]
MPMGPLIVDGAAWIIVLTVLLLELSRLTRRGRHVRWHATGLLVLITGLLASALAEQRGWPPRHLHVVQLITLLAILTGIAFLAVGIWVQASARHSSCTQPRD